MAAGRAPRSATHGGYWPRSGLVEVVTKLRGPLAAAARAARRDFGPGRYDLVILIDYPGFHLRVAEAARAAGTRVLYYIAPQLWAWRPGRARRLAAAVDRLAVVLPFEQPFFGRLGLRSEYVGHPLVDRAPRPDPGERASASSASPAGEPGARHLSRQPGPGDPPALGAVSGRRAAAARRGALRPGARGRHAERRLSRPGAGRDAPGRSGAVLRRGGRGAGQVGHHHARGGAGRHPDGGGLQGPPAHLAGCSSGCSRCAGSAWSIWWPSGRSCRSCCRTGPIVGAAGRRVAAAAGSRRPAHAGAARGARAGARAAGEPGAATRVVAMAGELLGA